MPIYIALLAALHSGLLIALGFFFGKNIGRLKERTRVLEILARSIDEEGKSRIDEFVEYAKKGKEKEYPFDQTLEEVEMLGNFALKVAKKVAQE